MTSRWSPLWFLRSSSRFALSTAWWYS